jgi:hypothetical protein
MDGNRPSEPPKRPMALTRTRFGHWRFGGAYLAGVSIAPVVLRYRHVGGRGTAKRKPGVEELNGYRFENFARVFDGDWRFEERIELGPITPRRLPVVVLA